MRIIFLILFYLTFKVAVNAQSNQFDYDYIEINLKGYSGGKIQWQFSEDRKNWKDIKGGTNQKLIYHLTQNGYFRVKVNDCSYEFLSDTTIKIKTSSYLKSMLDSVKICRWKNNASSCVSFTFDDNSSTHKEISHLLNQYNFKASFFVTACCMLVDSLKDISADGHEIGNHTYTHINLLTLDSSRIDSEIRKSKEEIETKLGIKCVSFADPYHANNVSERKIVFKNHLFDRDYSEYRSYRYYDIGIQSTMLKFMDYVNNQIKNRDYIMLCGHLLGGNYSTSTPKDSLIQYLNVIKKYSDSGDLWVTTLKEGEQYDNLYHEVSLEKEQTADTLKLNFINFKKEKYKDLESSPISFEIPFTVAKEYSSIADFIEVRKLSDRFIFTIDLKIETNISFVIKDFADI